MRETFAVSGFLVIVATLWAYRNWRLLMRRSRVVPGTIIEFNIAAGADGPVFHPVVEYVDAGKTVVFTGEWGRYPNVWQVGESIAVALDTWDNAKPRLYEPNLTLGMMLGMAFLGAAFIAIAIFGMLN